MLFSKRTYNSDCVEIRQLHFYDNSLCKHLDKNNHDKLRNAMINKQQSMTEGFFCFVQIACWLILRSKFILFYFFSKWNLFWWTWKDKTIFQMCVWRVWCVSSLLLSDVSFSCKTGSRLAVATVLISSR